MNRLYPALCILIQLVAWVVFAHPASAAEGKSLKIAMVLWRGETPAERGLKDGLAELGYLVEYKIFDADQDKDELATIIRKQIDPNVKDFDYVYCFGTTATKIAKSILHEKVPVFFNGVNAPVEGGLVNSMDAPGGNISGICNAVPIEKQIEGARKLISFKKLGVMYNAREKNASVRAEEVSRISRKLDFEVVELNVSPEGDQLQKTLQKIVDRQIEVDAIFIPSDSFLISRAKLIAKKLGQAKIPSIAAQKESVIGGALVGLAPDYYELGKMAAGIVDQHQKGKKIGEIPIGTSRDPKLVINKKTCELLGIPFPKDLGDGVQIIE